MLCTSTTQHNPAVNKFLLQMKPASFMQIYNKEILKAFTLILLIFPQLQKLNCNHYSRNEIDSYSFFKNSFLRKTLAHWHMKALSQTRAMYENAVLTIHPATWLNHWTGPFWKFKLIKIASSGRKATLHCWRSFFKHFRYKFSLFLKSHQYFAHT